MNRQKRQIRHGAKALLLTPVCVATLGALGAASASAQYTTINVSSFLNGNISSSPQTYPVGLTSGNQGTGIPFLTSSYGANNYMGTWLAQNSQTQVLTIDLTSLNISGQQSLYALLNNYYGTPGADEYDVTIKATNGDIATYSSVGGVDTRDYNSSAYTNTIANTTTPWFDNGIGQRLDVREFSLPTAFATDTLASFTITQKVTHDTALFSGLTFSNAPAGFANASAPEPGSVALLALSGLPMIGMVARRRKS